MRKLIASVVVVSLLVWCGAAYFLSRPYAPPGWQPRSAQDAGPPDAAQEPSRAERAAEPAIKYPIPRSEGAPQVQLQQLPLDESDRAVAAALIQALGSQPLAKLLRADSLVRHIVVTVDNLPRPALAARQLPVQPASGAFLAGHAADGSLVVAPENRQRYQAYMRIVEATPAKTLAAVYLHFYPLFQRAYEELGYPKGYFNDRLVAVIDHLLDAPPIAEPIALEQPHILYRFKDPALEAESAGHKMMARIGAENAEKLKAKLRELRREVTAGAPQN